VTRAAGSVYTPWSTADEQALVGELGAIWGENLCRLTYLTRLAGSQPSLVMHGGGNTSLKGTLRNLWGEDVPALFVKPSGVDMAFVAPEAFVALQLDSVVRLLELNDLDEDAMADEFACRRLRPTPGRPSIETLLHAAIPAPWVLHTHPGAILSLTNRSESERALTEALGDDVVAVSYARSGIALAHAVRSALDGRPDATALALLHHGLVTWGATAEATYAITLDLVTRAEAWVDAHRRRHVRVASAQDVEAGDRCYRAVAPVLRGVLGPGNPDSLAERIVLDVLRDPETLGLLAADEGRKVALTPPLTPDHLIRTRRLPLWLGSPALEDPEALREQCRRALEAYETEYRRYVEAHASRIPVDPGARWLLPRVVMVPGLGVVCVGSDAADARTVRDITRQALAVKSSIHASSAAIVPLGDEHLFDMEFGHYQRAKLGDVPTSALGGTVAVVTGAAGAIGSGICEALAEAGCHVAASDLAGPALESLTADLGRRFGPRVLAVPMDVTDPRSVAGGFSEVVAAWGGIDALVANAGVAHVAKLSDLSLEDFRRLERVNVEGTLLVLREAGRLLSLQGTGGDIVLVSTKNVFAPGAAFGAYSATKAAAHQLARIASLEMAPLGVRVNMVAPDAVFSHGARRSGLWQEVGPSRMKARGLDEAGLEDYYRSRNLLKSRVTAEHVAHAVLFFLTRQTPTTGATIPVDGGLPDATPR
jgi:rhamnose utilization protein RhaD (predicted bifunctional aldolase and dehydrogenase)/NAD(P)-dependent dehydrogenase (short-subunit alcohol dehydrogenase family)